MKIIQFQNRIQAFWWEGIGLAIPISIPIPIPVHKSIPFPMAKTMGNK
jgi:hypothetical protein